MKKEADFNDYVTSIWFMVNPNDTTQQKCQKM